MNEKPEKFKYLKRFLDNDGRVVVPGFDPRSGRPVVKQKEVERTDEDILKETIKKRAIRKKEMKAQEDTLSKIFTPEEPKVTKGSWSKVQTRVSSEL